MVNHGRQVANSNGEVMSSAYVEDHVSPGLDCVKEGGPSLTRQEFEAECDINTLMKSFEKTGVISHVNRGVPQYYDFTGMPDLQGALEIMIEADEAFMRLPATVRKEFDNDPVKFVAFAELKENLPQMREWGLAAPEKAPDAPMRVEVVNPPDAPKAP